ncbi:hypothetical protein PG987_006357 [Apiospora arundinis]
MFNLRNIVLAIAVIGAAPFAAAVPSAPGTDLDTGVDSFAADGITESPPVVERQAEDNGPASLFETRSDGKCDVVSKKKSRCESTQCKADENCSFGRKGCQMKKNTGNFKKPVACSQCRCINR